MSGCSVSSEFQPAFRELGLDVDTIFSHPLIRPWRTLPGDRDNSLLTATLSNGVTIRWHVKRYVAAAPSKREVAGHELLVANRIPTAPLVAWGSHKDGRSFVISEDLTGFQPADKLIASGLPFEDVLESTAALAARVWAPFSGSERHAAALHHRDLYLCHFFVCRDEPATVRLIDVARVASFRKRLFKKRWIVKDLAQFWYSTMPLPVSDAQRAAWLERYASQRGIDPGSLRSAVERKSDWIARHDRQLRKAQPARNISLEE